MTFFARLRRFTWARTPPTAFARGLAALERRRFEEALAHFAAAAALAESDGERAAIANKRGITDVGRGARAAALDAFVDALTYDPRHVPAIVNVGNLLLEDGAVDEAIVHYEAALRIDDDYAVAHLNLGVAYKRLGKRGDAVRELRKANRLEGRFKLRR